MGYNQNFGPNRKSTKHGKEMISRIMSGKDTSEGMDDYSYKVPAEKLEDIQNSKGLSRKGKGQDALDGMSGVSRHTSEHSTKEYLGRKDTAIKEAKKEDGVSRMKAKKLSCKN
jgi:hypothetical protein|tara:strand:- start:167 stop:505 length:339 start_codon:yes stop_codon:yes gene_type:complete